MGKKKVPSEDLIVPPQDQRICGTICVCQMTLVLSSVALVYLTVAIYMPSTRAFKSGIDETPVMCTTTRAVNKDNCDWGSCGEWCLSKTSGACIQIYVNLRNNGTNLTFQNCTNSANKTCYGIDQDRADKARCINDECKNLTGTFNCTAGQCLNITDAFECVFRNTDSPVKCSGRRGKINCMDITGLYSCTRGTCRKIRTPYNCDRRCLDIPTRNKNVVILSGDKVYMSRCQNAVNVDTGEEVWNETEDNVVMASCYYINNAADRVDAIDNMDAVDCINGSTLDKSMLTDLTNFTYLSHLHVSVATLIPEIAPPDIDLTISNESRLMINLEGCVNTLMDECKEFLKDFGRDGSDHNARARFPCFYAPQKKEIVVARFDLEVTYRQFLIASVIPSVLFVVSCLVLLLCQKTVYVGDDAKMRFKGCVDTDTILSKNTLDQTQDDNGAGGGGDEVMAL
ncbi:tipE homolog 3 phospholipid transfer protein [Musca autumnalis]|uniref:tipE homolog 3 phospholipid transfer protein n=1 Tax=Musca autumnalis TaxID=221902 RepID=UPI003CEBCEBE